MEVIRNQEFVLLPANEIAKLLASDDMNIPNEETILNALLTWVRHDLEQRRKDRSEIETQKQKVHEKSYCPM